MRRLRNVLWLLLLLPLLAACGIESNEDLAAPPEVQEAIYGEGDVIEEAPVVKNAGKPRLVEFYADW
jgi:hypothetical protein